MAKQRISKLFTFQAPISLALLVSFAGLYFGAVFGRVWIFLLCLSASLAFTVAHQLLYAAFGTPLTLSDQKAVRLLTVVNALATVSLLCFSIRNFSGEEKSAAWGTLIFAVLFAALCAFEIFYAKFAKKEEEISPSLPLAQKVRSVLPVAILLTVSVLLGLEIFGAWSRWDSYDYLYYFSNLSYSSLDVLDHLRPANHAAYGCSILFLLIDGIFGNPHFSLLLINLLMTLLGSLAFWRIVGRLFPHWHPVTRALMASVYAFSPFLFGLQYTVNLEAYLLFGLVVFFWGEVEKLPLVQVGAGLLICFSKETGAVLLAAIMGARLLLHLIFRRKNTQKRFRDAIEPGLTVPVLICGIFWLFDLMRNSWISSNSQSVGTSENLVFNAFGFNFVYIKDRLVSLLFTNLTWLVLLVVVVGFAVGFFRKKQFASSERLYLTVEACTALLFSLVPLFFFITYNHIRYAAPTVIFLLLLLPEALERMFGGMRLRTVLCGALACCLLVQSYLTVDPFMYLFFPQLNKGTGTLSFSPNHLFNNENIEPTISINSQYNREIMYFDRAFDDLLKNIEYDDQTLLLMSNEIIQPTVGGYVYTEYLITGFGYPYMETKRYMAWDSEREQRYLSENPDDQICISYTISKNIIFQSLGIFDRCIYISLPFVGEEDQNLILSEFQAQEVGEGKSNGWCIKAYQLSSK